MSRVNFYPFLVAVLPRLILCPLSDINMSKRSVVDRILSKGQKGANPYFTTLCSIYSLISQHSKIAEIGFVNSRSPVRIRTLAFSLEKTMGFERLFIFIDLRFPVFTLIYFNKEDTGFAFKLPWEAERNESGRWFLGLEKTTGFERLSLTLPLP